MCSLSRKRLTDPVYFNSALVERTAAALHQPGGVLYRPDPSTPSSPVVELSDDDVLLRLSSRGLQSPSVLILRVDDIGSPPQPFMSILDAARDFSAAIRRANQTDLVSQGPLELKSVEVIPPRIVVDQAVYNLQLFPQILKEYLGVSGRFHGSRLWGQPRRKFLSSDVRHIYILETHPNHQPSVSAAGTEGTPRWTSTMSAMPWKRSFEYERRRILGRWIRSERFWLSRARRTRYPFAACSIFIHFD